MPKKTTCKNTKRLKSSKKEQAEDMEATTATTADQVGDAAETLQLSLASPPSTTDEIMCSSDEVNDASELRLHQETVDSPPNDDMMQQVQPELTRQGNAESSKEDEDGDPSASSEHPQQSKQTNLQDLEFEKIIYNPATHKSAWDMLVKVKCQNRVNLPNPGSSCNKSRHRVVTNSSMHLRSADPRPEPVCTPAAEQVGSTTAPAEVPESATSAEGQDGISDGEAMVAEIINRYKTNKMKVLRADHAERKEAPLLDDLELELEDDDDLLWDDDLESPNQKSDFLKYTIPQWELKDKLYRMHYDAIENLTMNQVVKLCRQAIPDLQNIMDETVACERHNVFKVCGVSKQSLRDMTITKPFTIAHDFRVMKVINEMLFSDRDPADFNGELLHYLSCVLVPEAYIRIYAFANSISTDLAEKELRFGAAYDGTLSEDVLKSLNIPAEVNNGVVNKENIY